VIRLATFAATALVGIALLWALPSVGVIAAVALLLIGAAALLNPVPAYG